MRQQVFLAPDSKVHGANMGPIWDRQDPGGPHVGPMNFAIWDMFAPVTFYSCLITIKEITNRKLFHDDVRLHDAYIRH